MGVWRTFLFCFVLSLSIFHYYGNYCYWSFIDLPLTNLLNFPHALRVTQRLDRGQVDASSYLQQDDFISGRKCMLFFFQGILNIYF